MVWLQSRLALGCLFVVPFSTASCRFRMAAFRTRVYAVKLLLLDQTEASILVKGSSPLAQNAELGMGTKFKDDGGFHIKSM